MKPGHSTQIPVRGEDECNSDFATVTQSANPVLRKLGCTRCSDRGQPLIGLSLSHCAGRNKRRQASEDMGNAAVTDAERIVRHTVVVSASLTLWRLALRHCDVHRVARSRDQLVKQGFCNTYDRDASVRCTTTSCFFP